MTYPEDYVTALHHQIATLQQEKAEQAEAREDWKAFWKAECEAAKASRDAACHERDATVEALEKAERLAYIGEHHFPDLTWKARCEEAEATTRRLEAELAVANGELAVTTKRLDRIETWLTERGVVPIDAPENVGNGTHGHIKERLERLVTQEQAKGREQERETTRRLRAALEATKEELELWRDSNWQALESKGVRRG